MGLPSGDTITINSGSVTLRGNKSFSVSMEIQDKTGGTDFSTSYNMTISDIGDYEYNVDVKEDTTDVNEFYVNVPTFSFSFWSDLNGSEDFGNILNQLTFQDLIKIEVGYNGNTDYFICQKSDFKYDRLKREVECECYSPLKYGGLLSGGQIATFDTSASEIEATYSDDPNPQDPSANLTSYTRIITFNDLLDAYLATFDSDSIVKQTDYSTTKAQAEAEEDNVLVYTREDNSTTLEGIGTLADNFYIDGFEKARTRILEASIAEAAMVGNGFGTAFYVKRNDTSLSNTVDIYSSDLEEFNIQFFTSPVKSIQVGVGDTSSSETIISDNPQTVIVEVPSFASEVNFEIISTVLYAAGSANPAYSTPSGVNDDLLEDYKNILGVKDSVLFSGTILGASKVKPYETITLDTGISDFVDSTNNIIRFSKVKYNLKEDKMEWEGYSIN